MDAGYDAWTRNIIETFRSNNGHVPQFGRHLVLLHHIGARTGTERIAPVRAFPTDAGWLIVASKGGAPQHPAWYHNLRAHPEVTIETPDDGTVEVTARELSPDERAAAWQRIVAEAPGFADYEQRTTRTIPVLELERR
ncbi:nitroreductase family deazaflavin-dependent oxidoreductase [Microbacterium sp. 10M-3C3]|uniref:nitroreductase family deazaflavin-dependent oxidoreductase n=1 Tax=Microbacterium sp. 10M-3C3 TaxID=2483401 RepID=UPI000F6422EC|nr:nitroreductase family deazaflavin-dependent oxidoreductase [Microbacterium sp. 10M-3C3]